MSEGLKEFDSNRRTKRTERDNEILIHLLKSIEFSITLVRVFRSFERAKNRTKFVFVRFDRMFMNSNLEQKQLRELSEMRKIGSN